MILPSPAFATRRIKLDLSLKRLFPFFSFSVASCTSPKAQQPFAMNTEYFGSSHAKTENRYSDLSIGQIPITPDSYAYSRLITYEVAEQRIGCRS